MPSDATIAGCVLYVLTCVGLALAVYWPSPPRPKRED